MPQGSTAKGYQYISPNLSFPCNGVVSKWKLGVAADSTPIYLQVWRPNGTDYSRVAETVHYKPWSETTVEVITDMTVSAGDVIGIFSPRYVGVEIELAPVPDHTLLQGSRSDNTFSPSGVFYDSDVSSTVVGSSPLVSVAFGETP